MLEHAAVIIRGLARCIADESRLLGDGCAALRADTREVLAEALGHFATALRAHGRLVWTEGAPDQQLDEAGLEPRLAGAGQAVDRLNGSLLAGREAEPAVWPLHGELLVHLDRLRQELEVEQLADGGKDVRWRARQDDPARQGRLVAVAGSVRPVAEKVRPVASLARRGPARRPRERQSVRSIAGGTNPEYARSAPRPSPRRARAQPPRRTTRP